jgi:hypothetical protein
MITISYKNCPVISLGELERKTKKDFDWVYERFLLADGNAFPWWVEFDPDREDEENYLSEDKLLTEALHEVGFPIGSMVWISVSC